MDIELNARYEAIATQKLDGDWSDHYWSFLIVGQFTQFRQTFYVGVKDNKQGYLHDIREHSQLSWVFDADGVDVCGYFRLVSKLRPRKGYHPNRCYPVG